MNNDKKVTYSDGATSDLQQRRRLLKRGLLLVPAIITLRAQPAMAATNTNTYGYCSYNFIDQNHNEEFDPGPDTKLDCAEVYYTQEEADSKWVPIAPKDL